MAAIDLPLECSHLNLLQAMQEANLFTLKWDRLVLRVPEGCFVESSAIAFLCGWGLLQRQQGRMIRFVGNQDVLRYLSRMDLFRYLDIPFEEHFNRHLEAGRFIPVMLIEDDHSVLNGSNAICDVVLRTFDNGREFVPALEWAVYELVDNIHLHAETPVPGVVCAQFYPKKHRIDIGICDMGRGIKASLGNMLNNWDGHGSAIRMALERGVTRDRAIGQGNGLAGSLEIVRINRGEFKIWSGNASFHVQSSQTEGYHPIPMIPGTGIFLRLDTDVPVDLRDTFIGQSSWSYIDALGGRVMESGGLQIKNECHHFGSRQAAAALRRKVQAILPDLEEPLVFDFIGIEQASSSFLDELFGRLAEEIGVERFRRLIRVVNAPELMINMINVVIQQRISTTL